ncbi:MAG: hypothetical protein K2K56_00105 [Lachnospiraceae bacterium]|nr:hypothetical protein [Lachnospiraceae bacterium]
MELAAGSGSGSQQPDNDNDSSVAALSRVECLNMRGDGNKGTVYVVPEDMTDVILVYFGGKKITPEFKSDDTITYKEIHTKTAVGSIYNVACTMYFVTKLKKGTGITNLTGYPYLVRIKGSNAKGGNITKETISGKTYFANDTLKDVFLLQSNMAAKPVDPVFQEAPDNPIITFKQLAAYSHALDNVSYYGYSLYYIPELRKSSAITKHTNGILFY